MKYTFTDLIMYDYRNNFRIMQHLVGIRVQRPQKAVIQRSFCVITANMSPIYCLLLVRAASYKNYFFYL